MKHTIVSEKPSFGTHVSNFFKIVGRILIDIPVDLMTFIVVPIALLGCKRETERLPKWARLWDDMQYGINGDPPWKGPDHANGHEREYLWRLRWLTRNRANTWAHELGATGLQNPDVIWNVYGDTLVSNRPGHEGMLYVEARMPNGKVFPCYYYIKKTIKFGEKQRCFRAYVGFKLKGLYEDRDDANDFAQFAYAINPVMGYFPTV